MHGEGLDLVFSVVGETAGDRHVGLEMRSYPLVYPQNGRARVWCEETTLMSRLERSPIPTHVFYFD